MMSNIEKTILLDLHGQTVTRVAVKNSYMKIVFNNGTELNFVRLGGQKGWTVTLDD